MRSQKCMSLVNCNKVIRNNQYVQVNVQKWLNEKEPGLGSKMKAINLLTLLYAIVTLGVITKKIVNIVSVALNGIHLIYSY